MRRLAIAAALGIAAGAAWAGAATTPAHAHAVLEEADPANGELLEAPPDEILLAFSEPPDPSLAAVEVVDATGARLRTGPVEVLEGPRAVRVRLGDVPDGVYTVSWRVVSTVDGHLTSGTFSFGVGVSPAGVRPAETATPQDVSTPTPLAVAGRWGLYAGLVVLMGAAVAGILSLGPARVARPWLLGPAWGLAAAGVVAMTLEERRVIGVPLGTLLEADAGAAFVRLAVAVAACGAAALAVAIRPGTPALALLAGAAGVAMGLRATGGHAGASTTQAALQGMHFAAAGAWIGGLAWLVAGARRGLDAERVRRTSNVAASALGVLLLTGVLRATNELGGPGGWLDVLDADYGVALVVKLAIVAALVALGALNRFRNVRRLERLGRRPLLRTVGGELALAAGVLAMTGVLTGFAPRDEAVAGAARPREAEPIVVNGSDFATTTRVRLEIAPGTVGANAFSAEVTDFDTGEPVPARRVTLTFRVPDRPEVEAKLELERRDDGSWQAGGTALSIAGTWEVRVLVETASSSIEVPLEVTPTSPEQRVEISRVQGQPDLYTFFLADGRTLQAYVDPGEPGRTNQVHLTAFDADGAEFPLEHATLEIAPPGAGAFDAEVMRLSAGHFVANVALEPGTSSFRVHAVAGDGTDVAATFEQTFEP
jgi:copper transport protein